MWNRILLARPAAVLLALISPALSLAWGWQGHKLISEMAVDRLPVELRAVYTPLMRQLLDSTVEPDKRLFKDPREGPKHFLNVEVLDPAYREAWDRTPPGLKAKSRRAKRKAHQRGANPDPGEPGAGGRSPRAQASEGPGRSPGSMPIRSPASGEGPRAPPLQLATFEGRMPLPAAEVDQLFGRIPGDQSAFFRLPPALQKELGSVVYQPAHYHAELVKAFRSGDGARIAGVTGFLSHYIGDLHVPLHNTIDHEGAFSKSPRAAKGPNSTVHSRFESGFLKFLAPALPNLAARHLKPATPQPAAGITARAIREAREAYALYPLVIQADAESMGRHRGKTVAWQRFHADWEPKMAPVVATQLARSAQMLADVILSAWNESRAQ